MAAKGVIELPHIGIRAGYELSNGCYNASKPTCILINPMCTTVSLYRDQLSHDKRLTSAVNLLAIEPLGHGATTCIAEHFTYWDSAIIGIQKCFALGTSQGGWIVARMALLEPGRSMDAETAQTREEGCRDPAPFVRPFIEERWSSKSPTPDFVVDDEWIGSIAHLGFGKAATPENTAFSTQTLREVYKGDEGRRKLKMATIALVERDGLLFRLPYITCPLHWLHVSVVSTYLPRSLSLSSSSSPLLSEVEGDVAGFFDFQEGADARGLLLQGTDDPAYSPEIPKKQIKQFTGSKEATLDILEGGAHFLNATHPKEMVDVILQKASRYGQ
ncbi:alpha/beta hydrolase [Apiospora phragmitis]|uniref:Alpha/beta hydrolase n=1 Tax=Apiospora phragmitis TaxID=2905665 RepID=A0ABR1UIG6_9PEZI